mmetsp:Transcript_102293/g.181641  ORF Transcript_102293/g.181641 Transcript_102293/m.181641 type:complete len:118 (+) Transcript_102293:74-427(+)
MPHVITGKCPTNDKSPLRWSNIPLRRLSLCPQQMVCEVSCNYSFKNSRTVDEEFSMTSPRRRWMTTEPGLGPGTCDVSFLSETICLRSLTLSQVIFSFGIFPAVFQRFENLQAIESR